MSDHCYPFAAAPDIIRANQKDAHFQGVLLRHLSNVVRRQYGARNAHRYATEASTLGELLYLGSTTLIGNPTLGEEYCDLVQREDDTLKSPHIYRRAGYIVTAIIVPYSLDRAVPVLRTRLRAKLETNLRCLAQNGQEMSRSYGIQSYILNHLATITSFTSLHAVNVTLFYFTGAYYQISKRIFRLRYIFTRRLHPSETRVSYEVLGVLLLLQVVVQTYLHLRSTIRSLSTADPLPINGSSAEHNGSTHASADSNAHPHNDELLLGTAEKIAESGLAISKLTNMEIIQNPRYNLEDAGAMQWIHGDRHRKCTLCLEELKDPSVVPCGHVFCWACIGDWTREKPECPLCRREALLQHILPLRM